MTDLETALARMPHRGAMRLIAGIVTADERAITCHTTDHRDPTYPLRLDGVLHTATLTELGAQAAAAHASLRVVVVDAVLLGVLAFGVVVHAYSQARVRLGQRIGGEPVAVRVAGR